MKGHSVRTAVVLLIGFLAACGPVPGGGGADVGPPGAAPDLGACGATALIGLIGGPVAALPASGGWQRLRIIHPGEGVTMDFSETRLNVEVDAQDRITRLSCG